MIDLTLRQIADLVGGTVVNDVSAGDGVVVSGPAFVDSRAAEAGGLFVAVVGERVDGHDYAEAAVERGAAAVLGSRDTGFPGIVVTDPVPALGVLAREVLSRLDRVRVVAITGSQGKTSTKDLVAHLLASGGETVATRGSFNNEIGLPLTVLRTETTTDFLVLEMGARGRGHLRELCAIAPPDLSLVLNVGKAHVGEFGSVAAIAVAKGEIVEALSADGVAVLNADDPRVLAMAERTSATVRTFGRGHDADLSWRAVTIDASGRPAFDLVAGENSTHVELPLVGEHHAGNAAAAAAVALALGVPLAVVGAALASAVGSPGRMQVHERADGVTVVDDAFNANPDSMKSALETLARLGRGSGGPQGATRRTVAVLGEMRELGESSEVEHAEVGRLAARLGIDQILVVGESARAVHAAALAEGGPESEARLVEDKEAALEWLAAGLTPGDVVLFKASHAAGLEELAARVLAATASAQGVVR